MSVIVLRAADRFDAYGLARLRAASLRELGLLAAPAAPAFIPRAAREFAALFAAERVVAWVACDGARLIGSSCAVYYDRLPYPDGSRHAELGGVYVMPAYRNQGVASELVREVAATTRATARRTFLRPARNAAALYERLGFVMSEIMTLTGDAPAADAACEIAAVRGDGRDRFAASAVREAGTLGV